MSTVRNSQTHVEPSELGGDLLGAGAFDGVRIGRIPPRHTARHRAGRPERME